eukprot:228654-Rhodomonas_salina.1
MNKATIPKCPRVPVGKCRGCTLYPDKLPGYPGTRVRSGVQPSGYPGTRVPDAREIAIEVEIPMNSIGKDSFPTLFYPGTGVPWFLRSTGIKNTNNTGASKFDVRRRKCTYDSDTVPGNTNSLHMGFPPTVSL